MKNLTPILCCVLCIGITACKEGEISSYTTAKEGFLAAPTWQKPASWAVADIQHISQLAVFNVANQGKASLSILQGNGGGLAANVNRWRRQLGLLPRDVESIEDDSRQVGNWTLVKILDREEKNGIFGAIHTGKDITTFAKLSGDVDTLNHEAETFLQFITSISWEQAS